MVSDESFLLTERVCGEIRAVPRTSLRPIRRSFRLCRNVTILNED